MDTVFQSLVMPNLEFGVPLEMYVRTQNTNCYALFSERRLVFEEGGRASFDTFFGGLTVSFWKDNANLEGVKFKLYGSGSYVLRFASHALGRSFTWHQEATLDLSSGSDTVELDFWDDVKRGMVFVELTALEVGTVTGGEFTTETPPVRDVKLGLVMTHFNRKAYALPAIRRLTENFLLDPKYRDNADLFVIDNSRTIEPDEAGAAIVIPNKNLGGSGGFMRGLMELRERGSYTHCLFMDDDASCEPESIRRVFSIMQFATAANTAVAGALLPESHPYVLYEKGATFDGFATPLKAGLDMRDIPQLLLAEVVDEKPDYGGWWLFGFDISEVENFAFPFFVRGDDTNFGFDNDFDIVTMNGICSWGEDFETKSGPMPIYLDTRYHLVASLRAEEASAKASARLMNHFMLSQLVSYNYASAEAVNLALEHVLEGPEFFEQNLDAAAVRSTIGAIAASEKMLPIDRPSHKVKHNPVHESRWRRRFRRATLNGYLLPSFMMRDDHVFQHKHFSAVPQAVFGFRNIYFEHEQSGTGYVATFDRDRGRAIATRYAWLMSRLMRNFKSISNQYLDAWADMTSESAWKSRLEQNRLTGDETDDDPIAQTPAGDGATQSPMSAEQ